MSRTLTPWTIVALLLAMLVGTVAALVELALGRDIETLFPRGWTKY